MRYLSILGLLALGACAQFDDQGHRVITERNHTSLTTFAGAFDLGPCKAADTRGCGQGIIDGGAIKNDIASGNVVWVKAVDGGALQRTPICVPVAPDHFCRRDDAGTVPAK